MVKIVRDKKDLKTGIEIIQDKSKELFKKNSEIKKIFEGCLWAEGPVFLKDANLLVWSDIPFNRMLYFDISNGKTGVFRNPSYFSNGNSVDLNGNQMYSKLSHWTGIGGSSLEGFHDFILIDLSRMR